MIGDLAAVISNRAKQTVSSISINLEFGTIDDKMNLIPDSLKGFKISPKEYLVNRTFLLDEDYPFTETLMNSDAHSTVEGKHDHGSTEIASGPDPHAHGTKDTNSAHKHEIKVPPEFNKLSEGDRVLIAWVNSIAVILCVVVTWEAK